MTKPETYVAENIVYDWNRYKKKHYKKFFHEMSIFWKSKEAPKRSAVVGFTAIFNAICVFSLLILILLLNVIAQYLIPCPLIHGILNSILNIIQDPFLKSSMLYLIIGVVCLLFYIYSERDAMVHNSEFYRYWSPKFTDFLNNRFDNKLLLNFITDHISFLESERSRLGQTAQSVVIAILLNIILTQVTAQFEMLSIEFLIIIICIIVAAILVLVILQRAVFLINGISNSKLLRSREVKTLLQLEILLTESRRDSKITIGQDDLILFS